VAILARTLAWAGAFELTPGAEEPVVGGTRREYLLSFEGHEVGLELTVVGGKVEGFAFDEDAWLRLEDLALEAVSGELRVASFGFTDREGKAISAPKDPAAIAYEIDIEGLGAQLREHHVRIAKEVYDAEGHLVYRQNEADDIRFPQSETGSTGGRLTGSVAVPQPGRYHLELVVIDLVDDHSISYTESFEIEAPAPTPAPE
jgi:hypothetical protein